MGSVAHQATEPLVFSFWSVRKNRGEKREEGIKKKREGWRDENEARGGGEEHVTCSGSRRLRLLHLPLGKS